jgi:hypothetical protein
MKCKLPLFAYRLAIPLRVLPFHPDTLGNLPFLQLLAYRSEYTIQVQPVLFFVLSGTSLHQTYLHDLRYISCIKYTTSLHHIYRIEY